MKNIKNNLLNPLLLESRQLLDASINPLEKINPDSENALDEDFNGEVFVNTGIDEKFNNAGEIPDESILKNHVESLSIETNTLIKNDQSLINDSSSDNQVIESNEVHFDGVSDIILSNTENDSDFGVMSEKIVSLTDSENLLNNHFEDNNGKVIESNKEPLEGSTESDSLNAHLAGDESILVDDLLVVEEEGDFIDDSNTNELPLDKNNSEYNSDNYQSNEKDVQALLKNDSLFPKNESIDKSDKFEDSNDGSFLNQLEVGPAVATAVTNILGYGIEAFIAYKLGSKLKYPKSITLSTFVATAAVDYAVGVTPSIYGSYKDLMSNESVVAARSSAWSAISNAASGIGSFLSGSVEVAGNGLSAAASGIGSFLSGSVEVAGNGLSAVTSGSASFLRQAGDAIKLTYNKVVTWSPVGPVIQTAAQFTHVEDAVSVIFDKGLTVGNIVATAGMSLPWVGAYNIAKKVDYPVAVPFFITSGWNIGQIYLHSNLEAFQNWCTGNGPFLDIFDGTAKQHLFKAGSYHLGNVKTAQVGQWSTLTDMSVAFHKGISWIQDSFTAHWNK